MRTSRRSVDEAVDGGCVLLVLVSLGLLHPEEGLHVSRNDLEDEDAAGGALRHRLKDGIFRKQNPVLFQKK